MGKNIIAKKRGASYSANNKYNAGPMKLNLTGRTGMTKELFLRRKTSRSTAAFVLTALLLASGVGWALPDGPLTYSSGGSWEYAYVLDCDTSFTGQIDIPSQVTFEIPGGPRTLPVKGIGTNAFRFCNVTTVTLPQSIEWINRHAFLESKIEAITIPDSVVRIEWGAFDGCDQLTTVSLPSTLQYLETEAFQWCTSLESITIPGGLVSWETSVFGYCRSLSSVTISNGIEKIPDYSFTGCWALSTVEIPESVTEIGQDAFSATGLEEIQIPSSVTTIGSHAFWASSYLEEVQIPSSVTTIGTGAFASTNLRKFVLPDTVYSLGPSVFADCDNLETVSIGQGFGSFLPEGTFRNCTNLKNVGLPSSLDFIRDEAFLNCESLEFFAFPESTDRIGTNAFSGCSALTSLLIPGNVYEVRSGAFSNCANLEACVFLGRAPDWSDDAFAQTPDVTVYGLAGRGFTTPLWKGVPCRIIEALSELDVGRVVLVKASPGREPDVSVVRAGETINVARRFETEGTFEIQKGDTVFTGIQSFVRIEFGNGSVFRAGPHSQVLIDERFLDGQTVDPATLMNLRRGEITIYKAPSGKGLYIKTKVGAFGVRGTTLKVAVSEHDGMERTVFEVLEGVVDFEREATGEMIEIRSGESITEEVAADPPDDTDPTLPPTDPGMDPTLPPAGPGMDPTLPPAGPGADPTLPPTASGTDSTLPLTTSGTDSVLLKNLKKLKKKLSKAKRAKKVAKVKKYKAQIKKLKKRLLTG